MIKYLLSTCFILTVFCFAGCKDDEKQLSPEEKKVLLRSKKWYIEDVNGNIAIEASLLGKTTRIDSSFNVMPDKQECVKNASYEFLSSGTLQYSPETGYCGTAQSTGMGYTTNADVTEIYLTGNLQPFISISGDHLNDSQVTLKIIEISATRLVLEYPIAYDKFLQEYGSMLNMLNNPLVPVKGGMNVSFKYKTL